MNKEMRHMPSIVDINYCTLEGKDKKCITISITRSMLFWMIGFLIIMALVSFFVGWGVSGIDTGLDYLGLSAVYGIEAFIFIIPVVGLVVLIGWFVPMTTDIVTILGIVANSYTDALALALFWFGLVAQIVILIHIILKLLRKANAIPSMEE